MANDTVCGVLASETACAPKSSSDGDGTIALIPIPEIGTAKVVLESALEELGVFTLSMAPNAGGALTVALRLGGHCAGLTNVAWEMRLSAGIQVQLC